MAKSKMETHAQSKAMHEKISKQIKALSVQLDKISKKIDKVCPCKNGMGHSTKKKPAKKKK